MDLVHELLAEVKDRIAEKFGLPDEVADLLNLIESDYKTRNKGVRNTVHAPGRDIDGKAEAVKRDYLANLPAEDIQSRHGISRRTMYNYIKR